MKLYNYHLFKLWFILLVDEKKNKLCRLSSCLLTFLDWIITKHETDSKHIEQRIEINFI